MGFRAWLRSCFRVFVEETWLSISLLLLICSGIYAVSLSLWIWGNAHSSAGIDYAWFLRAQSTAIVLGLLISFAYNEDTWYEIRPHCRFGFLAFCCLSAPWSTLMLFDVAPIVFWMALTASWTGFVFFYTRFYFTYRAYCDVCS